MKLRRLIAKVYWKFSRYHYVEPETPFEDAGIMVAAPHTSNWDFILMLGVAWLEGMNLQVLVKQELFKGPLGWFLRAVGGIAVDRKNPGSLVEDLIARAKAGERFHLCITPEGTRSKVSNWKSGFYRLSMETGLPVTLAYNDRRDMSVGLGPTFYLTGDVSADMDKMRAFFDGKVGVNGRVTRAVLTSETDV